MENLLVTTDWLAEHLADSHVRVVDIRGRVLPVTDPLPHYLSHRAAYDQAHIPNAVFVDWTVDIVEPDSHSLDVANPQRYAELMSALGIGDDTFVVAYDDAAGMFAARMWWALNYYGHSQVAVLDGGWQKWIAENRPVTAEIPHISPTTFTPRMQPAIHRSGMDVLAALNQAQIIDVRTPAEFKGEVARARRKGHIPNAVNLPRHELVAADGTLLAPDALRLKLQNYGIRLDAPDTVLYCNGGVSASYGLLALKAAGLAGGAVYDGSWKDWGNDDSKPIA